MARIVIAGGSFGGLTAATHLRKKLSRKHDISVISPDDRFVFAPSLPWVAFGTRRADSVTFGLKKHLRYIEGRDACVNCPVVVIS